jgi:hypothetical protein
MMTGSSNEILRVLQQSKKRGLTVHIKLRHYSGEVITTVEEIYDEIIVVEPVMLRGVSIPRTSFYIEEIESVRCPRILYNAPLYTGFMKLKSSLRNMREKRVQVPQ